MERLEWQRKASKAGVAKVPRSRFCQHALKKAEANAHTPCFTLIEQALSVFLTLIMFNDPWVLPDEVCVIVFTFFHEGEYDP